MRDSDTGTDQDETVEIDAEKAAHAADFLAGYYHNSVENAYEAESPYAAQLAMELRELAGVHNPDLLEGSDDGE